MNWYVLAQVKDWQRFPPNKQREFPFSHEPGYNRKATPFLGDETPDAEYDFNLYHVTTDLPGVIASERLKSRSELGGNVGLGGGPGNDAPHLISTTYDYSRALKIYEDMKMVTSLVRGQVPAHTIFNSFSFDWEDDSELSGILRNWLPSQTVKKYLAGDITDDQLGQELDKVITDGPKAYLFMQQLEQGVAGREVQESEYSSEGMYASEITGFTGSFEDMLKIDPARIAILQLVVKKNAKTQHIPMEAELRFNPLDVRVVRYFQPAQ
jgi:hypothetical protein